MGVGAGGWTASNTLFLTVLQRFLNFLGNLHFLDSAPAAPSALSAPGCTLVVPNLFLISLLLGDWLYPAQIAAGPRIGIDLRRRMGR
jgi:hypothetical protein